MSTAQAGDDSTEVTVTRGMLRRWAETLDDVAEGLPNHAETVADAIRVVLNAPHEPGTDPRLDAWWADLRRRSEAATAVDTSPDPESAEAAVLAPESDAAERAEQ